MHQWEVTIFLGKRPKGETCKKRERWINEGVPTRSLTNSLSFSLLYLYIHKFFKECLPPYKIWDHLLYGKTKFKTL